MPDVGETAPDFERPDQDGKPVRLGDLRGRPVVLYFYPGDFTPVCTVEACTFRDEFAGFESLDAQVIGVSHDSVETHAKFAAKYRLPFRLLSDPDRRVRKLYGVRPTLGLIDARWTFVIDAEGTVRGVCKSRLDGRRHVREAREILEALRATARPGQPS